MNDLVYVVKSHQRVERFFEKTYQKIIIKYGFKLSNVYIFVSLDEDSTLYKKKYPECNIIKAPLGVCNVDNFITNYFNEGQKIIYMNDDVSGIYSVDENLKFVEVCKHELETLINKAFTIMDENNITYGGLYPVLNTMFMSGGKEIKVDFGLIMDPFSFIINNKAINITISDKSDFEKSIQHFESCGALLRFNRYSLKVEYYGKKGGFQGRDEKTELETANKLVEKYKAYCNGVKVKNGGKTSIRFNKISAKKEIIIDCKVFNTILPETQQTLF